MQPERIVAYVQWFWLNQLEPHFRKEENVLLPHLNNMEDLRKRLQQEHAHIEDSISVVIHNMYWETLENLAYDLNAHIRWEERVLFNHIEQMLTEEKLITLGKALAEQKNCGVWEDSFW